MCTVRSKRPNPPVRATTPHRSDAINATQAYSTRARRGRRVQRDTNAQRVGALRAHLQAGQGADHDDAQGQAAREKVVPAHLTDDVAGGRALLRVQLGHQVVCGEQNRGAGRRRVSACWDSGGWGGVSVGSALVAVAREWLATSVMPAAWRLCQQNARLMS